MQAFWLERYYHQLASDVSVFVYFSLLFLTGGVLLILILFTSRITKSRRHRHRSALRAQYQRILNKIIVNETFSEKGTPLPAFEFYMAELRLVTGNSSFARQLLITQLLELKKNLTGNSSQALVKTYYALHLYTQSLHNIRSFAWQKKALAIRELAEMECKESIPVISGFLDTRNRTLREETFMALVRLEDRPLSFLNHYPLDLSKWMRINIHTYLSKLDHYKLPVFSQWFDHPNLTVRLFCISMARVFRQTASLPGLVDMLYSADPKIVRLSVITLGELEAYQYRREIANLASHVWNFEKLAVSVVRCLGIIGDMETDAERVSTFLSHPMYTVRYEAVSALKKLGAKGHAHLQAFNRENNSCLEPMMQHLSEPLLE